MLYLAQPFSSPNPYVQLQRFDAAVAATAKLIHAGHVVFSPICHSFHLHLSGLPGDWEFWERQDRFFILQCTRLVVLTIDGWRDSKGVMAEIKIALEYSKHVNYWDGRDTFRFEPEQMFQPAEPLD